MQITLVWLLFGSTFWQRQTDEKNPGEDIMMDKYNTDVSSKL